MSRAAGTKNRNYPANPLEQALEIAQAIQDRASGMPVSRLTLSELVERSPNASQFRELLLSSRAYGLTSGGVNADQFELTTLGQEATGADEDAQLAAKRKAVMNVEPYRMFLTSYNGKKVPSSAAFKEFLLNNAAVPEERLEDCVNHILEDARHVGVVRQLKTGEYVDLSGVAPEPSADSQETADQPTELIQSLVPVGSLEVPPQPRVEEPSRPAVAKKVFIAHGKNRIPLDQLKKILDQFKVRYAVAIEEPNRGRPISAKVAALMRDECSSGIFIFTADQRFVEEAEGGVTKEVWRPSENVIFELGAASILYDRRIVIFKDKRVSFPTDFSDLGYIEFEADKLEEKTGSLFGELVALDILEVRAKG